MNRMPLDTIINNYHTKFKTKEFLDVLESSDLLMDLFDIDPATKRLNMQYWSRELGMCWQKLVVDVAQTHRTFAGPIRWGDDEPCDLVLAKTAIDTKYRVGSGDAGTMKKLKAYGRELTEQGYTPVMLILRTDNLQSSLDACASGGWKIYTGQDSFKFIERRTGMDLQDMLLEKIAKKMQLSMSGVVQPRPIAMQPQIQPHLPSLSGLPCLRTAMQSSAAPNTSAI